MFFVVVEYNNGNHINSSTEQLFWCWKVCKENFVILLSLSTNCYVAFIYEKHRILINEHANIKMKQNLCAINILLFILQINACLQWRNEA